MVEIGSIAKVRAFHVLPQSPRELGQCSDSPRERRYVKGAVVSYKRSHTNQYKNQNIVKIQGVNDRKSTEFYFGKKVAYSPRRREKTAY